MAEDKRQKGGFEHVGNIIEQVVQRWRKQSGDVLDRVATEWAVIVGPAIAQNTRPFALKGSMLIVNVESPGWIHQLQYLKGEIVSKVNTELGAGIVDDIKFRIGRV